MIYQVIYTENGQTIISRTIIADSMSDVLDNLEKIGIKVVQVHAIIRIEE